jgi:hypothetical protein
MAPCLRYWGAFSGGTRYVKKLVLAVRRPRYVRPLYAEFRDRGKPPGGRLRASTKQPTAIDDIRRFYIVRARPWLVALPKANKTAPQQAVSPVVISDEDHLETQERLVQPLPTQNGLT